MWEGVVGDGGGDRESAEEVTVVSLLRREYQGEMMTWPVVTW